MLVWKLLLLLLFIMLERLESEFGIGKYEKEMRITKVTSKSHQ